MASFTRSLWTISMALGALTAASPVGFVAPHWLQVKQAPKGLLQSILDSLRNIPTGTNYIAMGGAHSVPVNVPPTLTAMDWLGQEKDMSFSTNLWHDCGSGALVEYGYMQTFCDSYTTVGGGNGTMVSFTHNTMAYLGHNNRSDPTDIYQFGGFDNRTYGSNGFQKLAGAVPLQANETDLALWPWGSLITMGDNKTVIGSYFVNDKTGSSVYYTTLVAIDTVRPNDTSDGIGADMPTRRLANQLFYVNEIQYGNFGLTRPEDGYIYLWAKIQGGLKLARTHDSEAALADRGQYEYWHGNAWSDSPPDVGDASANALNFDHSNYIHLSPSAGNVYWSAWHNTFLAVIMDNSVAGTFWVSYSQTGLITGPYSESTVMYQTPPEPQCVTDNIKWQWNYAGFAHPGLYEYMTGDFSGQNLMVSWSACSPYMELAKLTWK